MMDCGTACASVPAGGFTIDGDYGSTAWSEGFNATCCLDFGFASLNDQLAILSRAQVTTVNALSRILSYDLLNVVTVLICRRARTGMLRTASPRRRRPANCESPLRRKLSAWALSPS